jgi:hypothetical protein
VPCEEHQSSRRLAFAFQTESARSSFVEVRLRAPFGTVRDSVLVVDEIVEGVGLDQVDDSAAVGAGLKPFGDALADLDVMDAHSADSSHHRFALVAGLDLALVGRAAHRLAEEPELEHLDKTEGSDRMHSNRVGPNPERLAQVAGNAAGPAMAEQAVHMPALEVGLLDPDDRIVGRGVPESHQHAKGQMIAPDFPKGAGGSVMQVSVADMTGGMFDHHCGSVSRRMA